MEIMALIDSMEAFNTLVEFGGNVLWIVVVVSWVRNVEKRKKLTL
jgi:hypothetical protein